MHIKAVGRPLRVNVAMVWTATAAMLAVTHRLCLVLLWSALGHLLCSQHSAAQHTLTVTCCLCLLLLLLLQVAKTMAPSVIYIDEVEKVFVSDKKKAREFGGQVRAKGQTPACKPQPVAVDLGDKVTSTPLPPYNQSLSTKCEVADCRPVLPCCSPPPSTQRAHSHMTHDTQELFSRIRKDLVKEMRALKPGDR